MEKLNNGRKNTSKVYYLNEENKKKLEGLDSVIYSKELNYALLLTDDDKDYIGELYDHYYMEECWIYGTNEDRIYNYILHETGVKK